MSKKAAFGSVVSIHYRGGVSGEEPIDVRSESDPLQIMLGDMKLPRGIENAIVGMEAGQDKTVIVPPELGYGIYHDELAQWYPRAMMEHGYELKINDVLFRTNPTDGSKQPAYVADATDEHVHINFNHPLAGKTLEYRIWLDDVK